MRSNALKLNTALMLFTLYSIIFYLIFTYQYRLDFSSLYSACGALLNHYNPYQVLETTYFPVAKKLPANLNPPFGLWVFSPLTLISYPVAMVLWSIFSFILGLIGAHIAFNLAFSADFLKKNRFYLFIIYLASLATLANTAIAQLGSLLLFFTMSGYYCYRKHKDYLAGFLWGIIITIKLFPALLFFYVVVQKRYRVFCAMVLTFSVLLLIPLLVYSVDIYKNYFSMMTRVLWYGDSWNASIYGLLFRLLVDINHRPVSLVLVNVLYFSLFLFILLFYLQAIRNIQEEKDARHVEHSETSPKRRGILRFALDDVCLFRCLPQVSYSPHKAFCLTLVTMLLLSPFGWLYYFSLLVLPLCLTWAAATTSSGLLILWSICLFFINFPLDYIPSTKMGPFLDKISFYSFHFYGLLLLMYLTTQIKAVHPPSFTRAAPIFLSVFSFDIFIIIISFLPRLS